MERLGAILRTMAARYRWHPVEALLQIQLHWTDVVSPELARVAKPVGFLGGTLTVAVPSPVWTQELQYWRDLLKVRLNERLDGTRVDRIRFVVRAWDTPVAPAPVDAALLARLLEKADEG
jgi:predicted nucleic acid-binding Zn ribbon protein